MVQLSSQNVKHGCLSDEEYCLRFYIGSFSPPHLITLLSYTQELQEKQNSNFIHVNNVYVYPISAYF